MQFLREEQEDIFVHTLVRGEFMTTVWLVVVVNVSQTLSRTKLSSL